MATTAELDALRARLQTVNELLSALEIGTLQKAPDGEWYACYWDEDAQRTQCERSAPPTPVQQQVLAMTPGERAQLQQQLTVEAANLVAQINAGTTAQFYGTANPATTTVKVTTQQTPQGPIQVITRSPSAGAVGTVPGQASGISGPLPAAPSSPSGSSPATFSPPNAATAALTNMAPSTGIVTDDIAPGANTADVAPSTGQGFPFLPNVPKGLVVGAIAALILVFFWD